MHEIKSCVLTSKMDDHDWCSFPKEVLYRGFVPHAAASVGLLNAALQYRGCWRKHRGRRRNKGNGFHGQLSSGCTAAGAVCCFEGRRSSDAAAGGRRIEKALKRPNCLVGLVSALSNVWIQPVSAKSIASNSGLIKDGAS